MRKKPEDVKWQWLITMGVCLVVFIVSLPIGVDGGVLYDLYNLQLSNWWLVATILSLGGFFISASLFIKEIYL
jgi:undecaprenyl pyrophosphate phosphatase UppP